MEDVDLLFLAWVNLSSFTKNSVAEKIHKYAHRKKIVIVEFGGDPLNIFVGPIFPNDDSSPCLHCVIDDIKEEWYGPTSEKINSFRQARIQENYEDGQRTVNAWQTSASLSIMSGLAVDQAIKVITGCEKPSMVGRRIYTSMQDNSQKEITYLKKSSCDWCGTKDQNHTS